MEVPSTTQIQNSEKVSENGCSKPSRRPAEHLVLTVSEDELSAIVVHLRQPWTTPYKDDGKVCFNICPFISAATFVDVGGTWQRTHARV